MKNTASCVAVCLATLISLFQIPVPAYAQGGTIEAWAGLRILAGEQSGFVSISAGGVYAGLKRDGSIVCWGPQVDNLMKVPAPNTDFVKVSVGAEQAIGLKRNGSVVVWGRNDYGQCYIPSPNSGYVDINATSMLGIKSDGSVVYFGTNGGIDTSKKDFTSIVSGKDFMVGLKYNGSLEVYGGYETLSLLPQPNSDYIAVAASDAHAAALRKDGSIVCWGGNAFGKTYVPEPNTGFVAVAAGVQHTVGLKSDGSVVCWGSNSYSQCTPPVPNDGFVKIFAVGYGTIGLKRDGSYVYWGIRNQYLMPGRNEGFTKLVGAGGFIAGIKNDTSLTVWGGYGYDQDNQDLVPEPNRDFIDVALGEDHVVAVKSDGSVVTWGRNDDGRCTLPDPNTEFKAVAATKATNPAYNLGLKTDGSVVSWNTGNLATYKIPQPNSDFTAIDAGDSHFLGLKSDGSVVCWGSNNPSLTTVPEPNTDYIAIAAGRTHNVALKRDGSIVCWSQYTSADICTVPEPNQDFVAIAAGYDYSFGLKRDGTVVGWGSNFGTTYEMPAKGPGVLSIATSYRSLLMIRSQQNVTGQIKLNGFTGSVPSQQFTATITSMNNPSLSQCLNLQPQTDGSYNLSTHLQPPYNIRLASPHFLASKATNVAPGQNTGFELVNGDANGDGAVNLFDYVVLDTHFNSNDPMADLDGDGSVNLFDYVVVDQSFGAASE
ncbi:MAG: dockerin type I domain-containing protein [Armatimonadota bacterium]